jgi:L-amino acid N-acyltransferase YncA
MASLINAGLPLMRTLSILIEQSEDKMLRQALARVHDDVESGTALSLQLGFVFVRVGDGLQRLREETARFADLDHVDHEGSSR